MNINTSKSYLGIVVILGSIWGFSEAALGMSLRGCASLYSGAVMTGVALFFMASCWRLTRKSLNVLLLVLIASVFKMFDALLLSFPLKHGAIGNPIFAFFMEGAAFLVLIFVFNEKLRQKIEGQAILGGMTALLAVNLFPLVKFATGVPACVFPGTSYPLSLYYAPVAVILSSVTVPLGLWAGAKIEIVETKYKELSQGKKFRYIVSPAVFILCLAIMALIRLG